MDLSTLSLAELKNLADRIPKEIERREQEERFQVLRDIEAFAKERGFALNELVGEISTGATTEVKKVKKPRPPVAIKYRNPANAEMTWTGRGRMPKWVEAFLAQGGTMEQLSV